MNAKDAPMRRGVKPAKPKAEVKGAATRKTAQGENSRVRDLEKRLAEALEREDEARTGEAEALKREAEARQREAEGLEQQTATSEILRVISRSTFDLEPVLRTLVENAVKLSGAARGHIFTFDGQLLHYAVGYNVSAELIDFLKRNPISPGRHSVAARAALERRVIHIPDVLADSEYTFAAPQVEPHRTMLGIPMIRGDDLLGVFIIFKHEVGPFTDKQIELVRTFADQAVITIENGRLLKALQEKNSALAEALDQQTATADILRVIASSPTDLQAVLDAVAETVARLCEATDVLIHRVDGQMLPIAASFGSFAATYPPGESFPIIRGSVVGRAVLERRTIHVHDLAAESDEEFPRAKEFQRRYGHRTVLTTPLMREGTPLGAIWIRRIQVRPFSLRQIKLLETFADQAVIAIENARLFKEIQKRNSELSEALAQQTATGEVLRVISRSVFDLEPVLETLIENATRLGDADAGAIFRFDGELMRLAAAYNASPDLRAFVERNPLGPGRGTAVARALLERRTVHIADVESDPDYTYPIVQLGEFRTILGVPMLREGSPIGVFSVWRRQVHPFTDKQIELVTTFADQGAIAIENVRLFNEIETKNRQLEAASQHKSEFLANMSHELRTPLNAIIGFSEVLSERMFGELNDKQDEYLKDIHASGQHLLSLINDILDLSKIEAGRMELELRDFDLPQAISNAVTLVRERAGRRGIALHQAVDPGVGRIRGDERKIKQVMLNLLSNALKFTPEGGRVEVHATVANDMAQVSVTDTGIGIALEDQEAVFEEFRQVGTADKKVEGTGLGLALSRKFIELHGGRIWVRGEVGCGSTFTFTLPLTIDHQRQTSE